VHRAVTLSEFVSDQKWRNRALYTEFYGPVIGMDRIIGVRLPAPAPIELYLTLLRSRRDFDERDSLVLNLLRPHLVAAYEVAEALTEQERELAMLRDAFEATGRAIVVLGPDRRVRRMSERAQGWLARYFGPPRPARACPPSQLDDWVRTLEMSASAAHALPLARGPLVVERDGRRLTVRLASEGGRVLLLLTEEKLDIEPTDLASLGLARREAEVLAWVASGKTNEAVAEILGLAPATIKHCLERVYAKLGVGSRAAATALAVRAAGRGG
jgi:DNA-binding CsgD family transcriptional regulator